METELQFLAGFDAYTLIRLAKLLDDSGPDLMDRLLSWLDRLDGRRYDALLYLMDNYSESDLHHLFSILNSLRGSGRLSQLVRLIDAGVTIERIIQEARNRGWI